MRCQSTDPRTFSTIHQPLLGAFSELTHLKFHHLFKIMPFTFPRFLLVTAAILACKTPTLKIPAMSLLCAWALSGGTLLEKFHMFIWTLFDMMDLPWVLSIMEQFLPFLKLLYIYLLSLLVISSLLFFLMQRGGSHYIGAPISFHHLPKSSLLAVLKYVKAFYTHGCFVL